MSEVVSKTLIQTGFEDRIWAWSWWVTEHDNLVLYTVYLRPDVDPAPRMAMSNFYPGMKNPVHVDTGPFEDPTRFGTWRTGVEFWEYVHNFVTTPEEA